MPTKELLRLLTTSFCLPFILLLVAPFAFYLGNHNEYTISLTQVVSSLLEVSVAITLILFLVLLFSSNLKYLHAILSGILVGFAACVWMQSQLFAWNFGLLDGQVIQWDNWHTHAKFEVLCWVLITSIAIRLALKGNASFKYLQQGVFLLGFLTVFSAYLTSDYHTRGYTAPNEPFVFHKKNNKILIVLDTFQSDVFGEIAKKWPEEVNFLRGFTFFPNTLGGYPTTKASLPLIISGSFYKNEIPFEDWLKAAYSKHNLIDFYAKKGYGVSSVSIASSLFNGIKAQQALMPIDFANETWASIGRQQLLILDSGLFRALPINLKPQIYNNGNWFFSALAANDQFAPTGNGNDLRFLSNFEKNAQTNSLNKGEFKFYHYWGVHAPAQLNEYMEYDKHMAINTKESYVRHARGILHFLKRKLGKLQELGIYDAAEIVVVGDHGVSGNGLLPGDLQGAINVTGDVSQRILGGARPLFLYKPAGAQSFLTTANQPLHLADVTCILSQENEEFACGNYKLSKENKNRERNFFYYNWHEQDWDKAYFPPMAEYTVRGDVRDVSTWQPMYVEYHQNGLVKQPNPYADYKLNTSINFTQNGNADKYIKQGWYEQEGDHRWTAGSISGLVLKTENKKVEPLLLHLQASAFPSEGKKPQQIDVWINGQKVASWKVLTLNWYKAYIPAKIVGKGLLNIQFLVSNPTAPCEVSNSTDCRKLGLSVHKMTIGNQTTVG